MKVHEYQGKELFRKYQIPTPDGVPVFSLEAALKAYDELAQLYFSLKRYELSESLFQNALNIRETLHNTNGTTLLPNTEYILK